MTDLVPITEDSLRSAMRDPHYWHSGHPKRQAYVDWVSDGFRALYDDGVEAKGGTVWVKPYTRTRDGHVENVASHWRSAPPTHGSTSSGGDGDIILAAKRPDPPWQQPMISEGGPARAGGGGGGGRASGRTDPRPSGARASRPLPSDLEEVLGPLEQGSSSHSNPEVRVRSGGLAQRQADFERIVAPGTARPGDEAGMMVGQTRGGHPVTMRESTSGPTLEVSQPRNVKTGSRTIRKYRYEAQ